MNIVTRDTKYPNLKRESLNVTSDLISDIQSKLDGNTDLSVNEICAKHGISVGSYYKIKKGLSPTEEIPFLPEVNEDYERLKLQVIDLQRKIDCMRSIHHDELERQLAAQLVICDNCKFRKKVTSELEVVKQYENTVERKVIMPKPSKYVKTYHID